MDTFGISEYSQKFKVFENKSLMDREWSNTLRLRI